MVPVILSITILVPGVVLGRGFLLALPYQGYANQLTCLVRAVYLAEQGNQTLLVPNVYPSKHDPFGEPFPFSRHFDLTDLFANVTVLPAEDFLGKHYVTGCLTFGKWTSFDRLGDPTRSFANTHHIEDLDVMADWPRNPTHKQVLEEINRKKQSVACIANLQHVHFGNIDDYINKIKWQDQKMHIDIAIHWRRGDFATACLNKNKTSCYPDISVLKSILLTECRGFKVQIFTNNQTEVEMELPEYRPIFGNLSLFEEMKLMTAAKMFYGNQYSTISRLVRVWRQKRGKPTIFF